MTGRDHARLVGEDHRLHAVADAELGEHDGARGTALTTDHGNGRTDIDITLLP